MHAHVLCSGPSLSITAARLRQDGDAGAPILAVNRGSTFMPYDWLVAGDRYAFRWRLPSGAWAVDAPRLGIVTFAADGRVLSERQDPDMARFWGLQIRHWEDLPEPDCAKQWSLQAALLFAHQLGAEIIHLYGCDHSGTTDYDGLDVDGKDADQRWKREGEALQTTCAYLRRQGCCVCRHLPALEIRP